MNLYSRFGFVLITLSLLFCYQSCKETDLAPTPTRQCTMVIGKCGCFVPGVNSDSHPTCRMCQGSDYAVETPCDI